MVGSAHQRLDAKADLLGAEAKVWILEGSQLLGVLRVSDAVGWVKRDEGVM